MLAFLIGCGKDRPSPEKVTSVATAPPAALLASWISVGGAALASDTNLPTLGAIAALPETKAFVESALLRFAEQVAAPLLAAHPALTAAIAGQAAPLLKDLIDAPTRFVAASVSNQVSWSLALKLSDARASAWRSNAWLAFYPDIRVTQKGPWTILGTVTSNSLTDGLFDPQNETTTTQDSLVRAELAVHQWPTTWRPGHLSSIDRVTFSLGAKGDDLRPRLVLTTARPLNFDLVPWQIPTNSIRDPLIGFTAVRGLQPWLLKLPLVHSLGLTHLPHQMILWHQALSPFSVTAAFPMENVTQFMDQLSTRLTPLLATLLPTNSPGHIQYNTNTHRLNWSGLPIVIPFIAPGDEPNILQAGLFPLELPSGKHAPVELFEQVTTQTNLLLYDWEITQDRLGQWRPISQIYAMVSNQGLHEDHSMSENWLDAIAPKLGNSGTKLTQTGPRELTLTRGAPLGLNALELVALARWVEPFPAFLKHKSKPEPKTAIPLPALVP